MKCPAATTPGRSTPFDSISLSPTTDSAPRVVP